MVKAEGTSTLKIVLEEPTIANFTFTIELNVVPNTAPYFSAIDDVKMYVGGVTAVTFGVFDVTHSGGEITIGLGSSDTSVLPPSRFVLSSCGADKSACVLRFAGENVGLGTITITADDGLASVSQAFNVTVKAPADISSESPSNSHRLLSWLS
eukprot:TRINITY_DN13281_c0_g1_i1.p1 TRINITY_DN13281_c0_g1~~TRINITY_DN13281_c0_g1_i1.p1  ORF type:complete len:153 (-),score=30.55 TRINITY_DN13281_c0_g1_i1:100-558(-)